MVYTCDTFMHVVFRK